MGRPGTESKLMEKTWMLWDGDCEMCGRVAGWVTAHDKAGRIRASSYQNAPTPPMTPDLYRACEFAVHTVDADGRVLRAGKACLRLLELLGHGTLARILGLPPFIWVLELGYKIVARNRPFFAHFIFTRG